MFKYDFVILYEHRNREMENAVLIAMMLEKKGYKVAIEFRRSARILFQKAKVLITPFFYNNKTIEDFVIQPFYHYDKVINMQYEQVFTLENEGLGNSMPSGEAVNAVHIAWGDIPEQLMKNNGIKENHIKKIGHVSMDMNMPKYNRTFFKRSYLARKYNLPMDKKWNLFISSFSCVGISDEELRQWAELTEDIYDFTRISVESQRELVKWLDNYLKNSNDIFIYRPHPHEKNSKDILALQNKYDNFVCISDYSIRQWIKVCDDISTWCSTSIVDAYFANKPCVIIRPISFSDKLQYRIYCDQKYIETYDDFVNYFDSSNESNVINDATIKQYYCNDFKADTFEKFIDVCEEVYNSPDKYDFSKKFKYSKLELLKIYIYKILMSIAGIYDYSKFFPKKYEADIFHSHREMYRYKKEIRFHKKRFSRILK